MPQSTSSPVIGRISLPYAIAVANPMNYHIMENVIHGVLEMRSTITSRGQTVIPAGIRHQFNLGPSDRLEWVVDGKQILVFPVHKDPITAFRGRGKGGATARLLAQRQKDAKKE